MIAVKFDQVGKQYRLGTIGTGTLSHDLNRWWARMRGQDDPFIKVGEDNVRAKTSESGYVWALKDISFEVAEGEVLGIIGKNGAGKSTLLKVLSRITAPTTGKISGQGRIASLLEVGTGFHPEMTGRENIFLNGAIMGMTRKEIRSKFDEIVAFAGVERYVDTPVKRYSSGMLVRLGFAVAAHLEPEILVIDEVLAVGDAEFQKKCIGKMESISHAQGRTILFVSHNMPAVEKLCDRVLVLSEGTKAFEGNVSEGIGFYLNTGKISGDFIKNGIKYLHNDFEIEEITINGIGKNQILLSRGQNDLMVTIKGQLKTPKRISMEVRIFDKWQSLQALFSPGHKYGHLHHFSGGAFTLTETVHLPENMTSGEFTLDLDITEPNVESFMNLPGFIKMETMGVTGAAGQEFRQESSGLLLLDRAGR